MLKIFIQYRKKNTSCRSCPFYDDQESTNSLVCFPKYYIPGVVLNGQLLPAIEEQGG